MRVSNDTMGGDPQRGADKVLRVQYSFNGQMDTVEINEDNDLVLPRAGFGSDAGYNQRPSYRDELVIESASYGARDRFADVTRILRSRVVDGTLNRLDSLRLWETRTAMVVGTLSVLSARRTF